MPVQSLYLKWKEISLGIFMTAGHFHEFHLAIKGHHSDTVGRCVLDLGNLLAGVGIDDSAWIHSQRLNHMNLRLEGDNANRQQKISGNLKTQAANASSAYHQESFE